LATKAPRSMVSSAVGWTVMPERYRTWPRRQQ
jgi:hypothetical protein